MKTPLLIKSKDLLAKKSKGIIRRNVFKIKKKKIVMKDRENVEEEIKKEATSSLLTSDTFEDVSVLNKYLIQQLTKEKYTHLTAIQKETISKLIEGYDVLIRSFTGSGKTLAFLVPIIQKLLDTLNSESDFHRSKGTRVSKALILAPTRELVNQTIDLAVRLTIPFPQIVVSSITGGEKRKSEKARLRKGVTLLGSTVGRLCDHLDSTNALKIDELLCFVLDEADRLLDLGFEKKIRWIVHKIRSMQDSSGFESGFQSILVSATLNPKIQSLANFFLKSERVCWVGEKVDSNVEIQQLSFPSNLTQYYTEITLKYRLPLLFSLLLSYAETGKVVVFLANCESVEFHHMLCTTVKWPKVTKKQTLTQRLLVSDSESDSDSLSDSASDSGIQRRRKQTIDANKFDDKNKALRRAKKLEGCLSQAIFHKYKLFKLHGNLEQTDRLGYLKDFNSKNSHAILFTTDVAARGLNLQNVSWIIQTDPPQEVEEYVHRAGRTARLNNSGNALLFLLPHELQYVEFWKTKNLNLIPLSELQIVEPLQQKYLPQNLQLNRFQNTCAFMLKFITRQVESDLDLLQVARRSFTASYRSYRCYSAAFKKYFDPKKLHLGHLASAFGLSESPKLIGEKCRLGVFSKAKKALLNSSKPSLSKHFAKVADGLVHDAKKDSLPIKKRLNRVLNKSIHGSKVRFKSEPPTKNSIIDKSVSLAVATMKRNNEIFIQKN